MKDILTFNKKILSIMKKGFRFCFYFLIFSSLILVTYKFYGNPAVFQIGISLFKSGLFFACTIAIFGIYFNKQIE